MRKSFDSKSSSGRKRLARSAGLAIMAMVVLGVASPAQTLTTLYNFGNKPDGADPQGGVVFDQAGNLFGATALGGISKSNGILYELSPPPGGSGPWTETVMYRFKGPEGKVPECRIIMTPGGRLVGTTSAGGANGKGTAFIALPPSTTGGDWNVAVMYSFGATPADGANPNAALLPLGSGYVGVTLNGGTDGRGTVFQLTPSSDRITWTETVLYSFNQLPDAAFPSSELTADNVGNLYGTALFGGDNNLGAVYRLSPPSTPGGSWTETVLHSFNGTDGTLPGGRLQLDSKGTVYGTTDGGGALQEGTVFQLVPPSIDGDPWTESVLFSFSGGSLDGGNPFSGVIMDSQGRLAGTASSGGGEGGVVFQLLPPSGRGGEWTEVVLHSFSRSPSDGFRPVTKLLQKDAAVYGVTEQGGLFGTGTVFKLEP